MSQARQRIGGLAQRVFAVIYRRSNDGAMKEPLNDRVV